MAGLLDDPNQVGLLSLGLRLMSTPGKFGSALGTSGLGAMGDMQQAQAAQQMARQRAMQEQMMQMQLEDIKRKQAEQQKAAETQRFDESTMTRLLGIPVENRQSMADMGPGMLTPNRGVDPMTFLKQGGSMGGLGGVFGLNQALTPAARKVTVSKPGDIGRYDDGSQAWQNPEAPQKPEAAPSSVREYQFAVSQGYKGTFEQFELSKRKAGATNIVMPKIELKMGDSTGGQVGPIVKDSKIQAEGAVKMFDAADRIEKAIASGQVMSGPLASKVMTVKQLVQVVGGGNDESIRQTRQVIKGLAQMALESRKELQGQGAVTESEAAAAAKAEAGDIDDLTTGELGDLAKLAKRAAHFRAVSHQSQVSALGAMEGTRATVPFYSVRGIEPLLKHNPQLPQIGGTPSNAGMPPMDAIEAELRRRSGGR